ncbi:MAG: rRNA maturation RNase YbeY [Candidatus Cloacimonadota bacterium]|nr:MAG: rRNA maturation RNase YbeY [Candidatus Cloacimonadota bacterium]
MEFIINGNDCKKLSNFTSFLSSKLDMSEFAEISISFVSESEMQDLNRDYRSQDKGTDILTFTIESPVESMNMGDIYLCPSFFVDEFSLNSEEKTLYFLLSHGFLHLLGWTHDEKDSFDKMMTYQKEILQEYFAQLK